MGHNPRSLTSALAGALVLGAASWGVGTAQTTRHVPEDFPTITDAIAASEKGDTILVGPGTYKESPVLTEVKGNTLIIRSTEGSAKTTIVYGEEENANEAVVTFQRCTNSTQFVGFHIDGRGQARRGILASSDSRPVLVDITVEGCDLGIAAHRGARPYLRDITVQNAVTAGLFISSGSADVRNAVFTKAEKFGVYVATASEEVRLRDVRVVDNGQVGVQVAESAFSFEDGEVTNNGDTGIILNETSPLLKNLTISGHSNIGIVMEICNGTLDHCRIADNEYGAVSSIEGSPRIFNCTFENNKSYHVGVEGDAQPLIGGSLEHANAFLGKPESRVQQSSTADVIATYNYWDLPCAPKKFFEIKGTGHLKRIPWASGNLLRSFEDCKLSRKYNRWWKNGKLDEAGNHIKHKKLVPETAPPGGTASVEAASAGGAPVRASGR
jgi:Periplasmic copper-binding protein (NosD)